MMLCDGESRRADLAAAAHVDVGATRPLSPPVPRRARRGGPLLQDSTGSIPIMHLVVLKRELADKIPRVAARVAANVRAGEEARIRPITTIPTTRCMIDGRMLYEQQRKDFGEDPWPNGFAANRRNLEQFIGYSHDQRLISSRYPVERLFHPSTYDDVRRHAIRAGLRLRGVAKRHLSKQVPGPRVQTTASSGGRRRDLAHAA